MFGDEGIYQMLMADLTDEIFSLETNHTYTLTFRTAEALPGEDIPTIGEDREEF